MGILRKEMGKFKRIAEVVSTARQNKGISQEELAKVIGYKNGQFISNIERGLCSIPAERVMDLCVALGVEPTVMVDVMVADYTRNLLIIVTKTEPPPITKEISLSSLH